MYVLTTGQMKQAEARSDTQGVSYAALMENAGAAAFSHIVKLQALPLGRAAVILCGSGNNGGDGFVLARCLCESGAAVTVVLLSPPKTALAVQMCERLRDLPVTMLSLEKVGVDTVVRHILSAALIVDAVFGTGFQADNGLPETIRSLFAAANAARGLRISMDIPSGGNADTGKVAAGAFSPDCTIAFGALKTGMLLPPCSDLLGELHVADIGMPPEAFIGMESAPVLTDTALISEMLQTLPKRSRSAHKGCFGKLLNIAGSLPMSGAAILSTQAALRSGVGLCTLATPRCVVDNVAAALVEATFLPLAKTEEGMLSRHCITGLLDRLSGASAAILGPGLGQSEDVTAVVHEVVKSANCPIILDADGINAICGNIDRIGRTETRAILTPHPTEMARLCGMTTAQVQADRISLARGFAKEYGTVLVLKGVNTVVADPDGRVFVNTTGNAGLSRGGSGDILTGMIGAFAAQGMPLLFAAVCGVYLHGLAADVVAEKTSMQGMLPTDLLGELPLLFRKMEQLRA